MLETKFSLLKLWKYFQVDFVNPTSFPVTINAFDSTQLFNYPTEPSGNSYPDTITFDDTSLGSIRNTVYNPTNGFIYIARTDVFSLDVFDTNTNSIVTNIPLPSSPLASLAYCSVSNKVYVGGIGVVMSVDCVTEVVTSITLSDPSLVSGLAYNPSNNSVYVTQPTPNLVYRIDCATDVVLTSIFVGDGNAPRAVVYSPNTDFVYIVNSLSTSVFELDPSTLAINSTTIAPATASASGLGVFVSSNNSFYYQDSTFSIQQFQCSTSTFGTPIAFGVSTVGMAYNFTNELLYIADSFSLTDSINVYSVTDNSFVATINTPTVNFGSFATLVYQDTKNSIYEMSSGVISPPPTYGIFEVATISQFYIVSPYNFNALMRDTNANPMMVRRIDLICQTQEQFNQPFNIQYKDADGNRMIFYKLPNINLSANQAQPNIATIDFENRELILDDNFIFANYSFPANSTTRMVVYYTQIKRIDLITKGIETCTDLFNEAGFGDGSITEKELLELTNTPLVVSREVEMERIRQSRFSTKQMLMIKMKEKLK